MSSESSTAGRRDKKRRRAVGITVLGGVAAAFIVARAGGCASSTIPAPLTDSQRAQVDSVHFRVVVGVEEFKYPVYSRRLVMALRETGLFDQVDHLDSLRTEPALVARVERAIYGNGTAAPPLLTGLSLGLIPTTVEEEHGYSFSLHALADPANVVPIEFSYRGPTTLGWYAAVLNLQKTRTARNPYTHPAFNDALAFEIVSHADEIRGLLR